MVLSELTDFWKMVQESVVATVGGVIREEEVVDTRPGAITVRPFVAPDDPDPGVQELRALTTVSASPGDRVLVLRLPALKCVIGRLTIRGVEPTLGASDLAGWYRPRSTWNYGPQTHGAGVAEITTITVTANRHYAMPFLVPTELPISHLTMGVVTGIASSTATLSIYDTSTRLLPENLIVSGTVDTSATGTPSYGDGSLLATLQPGWYFLGVAATAAIEIRAVTPAIWIMGASTPASGYIYAYQNRADTIPPSTFGPMIVTGGSYPSLLVRRWDG